MKVFTAILMFLCALTVSGQHYFGVRAGVGSGSSRVYPQREMGTVWGLKSAGVAWKYYSAEPFVGGIEVDALWMRQGWREFHMATLPGQEERERTGYYQRTVDVVMVPVMWQPHVYMFGQRMRFFLDLGVTASYIMSSEFRDVDFEQGVLSEGKYDLKLTRDNRAGYGLVGGGGLGWIHGRMELFAEARYYIGYSDILKNRNKYEVNPLRSPLDGVQIQVGAFFRLGKGIKSNQGRLWRERALDS